MHNAPQNCGPSLFDIAVEIGELTKPLKWRTMNAKTNAIAGNGADNITTIAP